MDKQRHYQTLAKQCVTCAEATLGTGWQHMSQEIRWGLVCANIVALHEAQDETISSANVRTMIREVTALCRVVIWDDAK